MLRAAARLVSGVGAGTLELGRKLRRGEALAPVALGSATLGVADAVACGNFLANPDEWDRAEPRDAFHDEFAAWNGSLVARGFASGREALSACLAALDLRPGDEAILPGYSCVVVPNAFAFAGLDVRYVDIELDTYGMDADALEAAISPRTRVVLVHHLFGYVCRDYERILQLARRVGARVIEDCAHATGASFRGVRVGNRGDFGFYSFEQSKVLNTTQGGVAVSTSPELARRLVEVHAASPPPTHEHIRRLLRTELLHYFTMSHRAREVLARWAYAEFGADVLVSTPPEEVAGSRPDAYGRRMAGATASLARLQLHRAEELAARRRAGARRWDGWSRARGLRGPHVLPGSLPVPLRYPVLVDAHVKANPSSLQAELGVEVGRWFMGSHHPVHRPDPACPRADEAVRRSINLPCLLPGVEAT